MKAAGYARGFRDVFGSELHVVYVSPALPNARFGFPARLDPGADLSESDLIGVSHAELRRLVAEQFDDDRTVVYEVLAGNPWYEVCNYAQRVGIDLIIVSTHGRTGLPHVLIGSVAERIVQHAPCPVLTIKNEQMDFTIGSQTSRQPAFAES